jgi:biopolymer transport protein ExbD
MKIPARPRESGVRFNITPLIDICFNLIVFFALASLYVRKENSEHVTLPDARQSDSNEQSAPRRLVMTVNSERRIFISGEEIKRDQIERCLLERCENSAADFEVRIRADKTVPFEDIKPMILACARHGVTNLKFAVQSP